MTGGLTSAQIRQRIAGEDATLERVTQFVRQGMRDGNISDESGEALIDMATTQRDGAVRLLRQLLGATVREEWQA